MTRTSPSARPPRPTTTHRPLPAGRRHPALYVLAGGLVAGTLDIVYACLFWRLKARVPARRIFHSVAAGLLGKASFEGGSRTAALGLGLHYFNATIMSIVYYLATGRVGLLRHRPMLAGAAYGLALYGVMNHIVVPLSRAGKGSKDPLWIRLSIVVHVFFVGIPIALITRRAYHARVSGDAARAPVRATAAAEAAG